MATKKRRPGYEPAHGRPDPDVRPPATIAGVGYHTHLPVSNGAACNAQPVPTNSKFYDPVSPTCPWCANYLLAAQRVTAARHPEAVAQAATAMADGPDTPGERK